jgi:hypothetical protein
MQADERREGPLLGCAGLAGKQANSARVEPHDMPLGAGATLDLVEQCREQPIAPFEPPAGGLGVRRERRRGCGARMEAVGDFHTLHKTFPDDRSAVRAGR